MKKGSSIFKLKVSNNKKKWVVVFEDIRALHALGFGTLLWLNKTKFEFGSRTCCKESQVDCDFFLDCVGMWS